MKRVREWLKQAACVFGIHDWEYLENKSEAALRTEIETNGRATCYSGGPRVVKKVCLDCGMKVDTYTPFVNQTLYDIGMNEQRRRKARELFGI